MAYIFSENVQRGILYLLKANKQIYLQIITLVKAEYFDFPSHQVIFTAIRDYYEQYLKLPTDTLLLEKIRLGLKEYSSNSFEDYEDEIIEINRLDKEVLENYDFYLDLIEDFAKKQEMKAAICKCVEFVKKEDFGSCEEVIRKALLINKNVDTGLDYFSSFSDRWKKITEEGSNEEKFVTPLKTCDYYLDGGLNRKEVAMVIACSNVGKSVFLCNQSVRSLTQGKRVLYISLEMAEDLIAQRHDSIMSALPISKLKQVDVQYHLQERIKQFRSKYSGGRLVIKQFMTGQACVNDIRALLVRLRLYEDFEPDVILIDYLSLLRSNRNIDQEWMAQERIAEEMRALAIEYNVLVWTAAQINREGSKAKIIDDKYLANAYGIIRPVDYAISLNQTMKEYDVNEMRAYVVKSRNGKKAFIVNMVFDTETLFMTENKNNREQENDKQNSK